MDALLWPEWPLRFGALLPFGLALVATALTGELLARRAGLPRVTGYVLAGFVMGPLGMSAFAAEEASAVRGVLDLALALLLFELGVRLDLRWFRANPWVLAASLGEAAASFILTFGVLLLLGAGVGLALGVAAIAVGTSPGVVMRVTAELNAGGQVTERLLALCALNVAYSVVLFKLVIAALHGVEGQAWWVVVLHPLYLLAGSGLAGLAMAFAFVLGRRVVEPSTEQGVVAIFGLLLAVMALLAALRLPAPLAPLVAGMLIKLHDPRPHLWPRHFGTAGGVLVIALFMLGGAAVDVSLIGEGLLLALAAVAARGVAKIAGVLVFGRAGGLVPRKSLALGVTLLPLSVLALLLVEDVRLLYPAYAALIAPVVMGMVAILGVLGPIATQRALIAVREHRSGETS